MKLEDLEKKFYSYQDLSLDMLNLFLNLDPHQHWDMFMVRPIYNDGDIRIECRLSSKCDLYINGKLVPDVFTFLFSAENRFFEWHYKENEVFKQGTLSFKDRLFFAKCIPCEHTIATENLLMQFKTPLLYNMTLLLMKWADNQYEAGFRVSDKAINWPVFKITEDERKQYNVYTSVEDPRPIFVDNVIYKHFGEYNDSFGATRGPIELHVVKYYGEHGYHSSVEDLPIIENISISQLLESRLDAEAENICPRIELPKNDDEDFEYWSGAQPFSDGEWLYTSVVGDIETLSLIVREPRTMWGGFQLTFTSLRDYYLVGDWLTTALNYFVTARSGESYTSSNYCPEPISLQTDNSHSAFDKLENLIGLQNIKQDVKELVAFAQVQKSRRDRGLKAVPVSLHLVFTGNPGTGKTSVARILAELYKEIGILSSGQLVEVDRADLVAGYVGQTAIKTQEKIKEAMGGILFIDEAYTLAKEGNDFGQEAIDTILKAMEDNRDQFIVIVAGYSEPMSKFINSNPGLKSRFNKYISFPDYDAGELYEIFASMCNNFDYILEDNANEILKTFFAHLVENKDENFANARDVRNLFESIITNQALRITSTSGLGNEEMMTISLDDINNAISLR